MNRTNNSQTTVVVGWLLAIAVAAMAFLPGLAAAQITIAVPNLSVPESSSIQTGTFDVSVVTTGGSLPEVGDFTVNLQLSPATGVDFTGGQATTANPYIFAGQSSGPTVMTLNSGTTIEGTDFASNPPTLVNGDGLLAVNYSIPANTSGTFNLTLVTSGSTPTVLDNQNVNPISFTVQDATLTVVPSTVYWNGAQGTSWSTLSGPSYATNWSTTSSGFTDAHALPGANTDVNFTTSGGGSNLSTTLGANFSIKGLTFTSMATSPVSISGNTLTIGADGLTVQSGAAAATINSAVTLSSSQSWMISGSNPLTINGTLSLAGQTLTKSGTGTVRVDAAPSLGNGSTLAVSAGTLELDATSGTATVGTNVSATVATSATLQLAGTVSALSDGSTINPSDGNLVNITNNGSTASGGGLLVTGTNQSVGVVSGQATTTGGVTTYSGDTVVGNGTTGANLTVTQLLQNTLTINAGSTVTLRPASSGSSPPTVLGNVSVGGSSPSTVSISSSIAPAVGASALSIAASSATVAASGAANAATPAAPVSDPFLSVQSAINSGSGSTATVAPTAATTAPIQAALAAATVSPSPASIADPVASGAMQSADSASSIVGDATIGVVATMSVGAIGEGVMSSIDTSSSGVATLGDSDADALALLLAQADNGLTTDDSSSAGLAAFVAAVPSFGSANSIPEPSSLVLLLLGCGMPFVVMAVRMSKRSIC